jgi:hypothetical protein
MFIALVQCESCMAPMCFCFRVVIGTDGKKVVDFAGRRVTCQQQDGKEHGMRKSTGWERARDGKEQFPLAS